jgi:peptidoglycan/xylan/chitin deacetylase (PgdA/CDA1 family)
MGFGATFYVTVSFLGRPGYMSVSQLRELSDLSFEIGCHSMTHPYLTDLEGAGLEHEIVDPKLRLEQIIGKSVDHFSCPGGRLNQRVVEAARRTGYKSLAVSDTYANAVSSDSFVFGRVPIMRRTSLQDFSAICRGRGLWRMSLRASLRQGVRTLVGNSSYDRIRAAVLGQEQPR